MIYTCLYHPFQLQVTPLAANLSPLAKATTVKGADPAQPHGPLDQPQSR